MKGIMTSRLWMLCAPALVAAFALAGCAAKKALWGDPQTGLILKYRMGGIQELEYRSSNEFVQNLEIAGQTMKSTQDKSMSYSIIPKGSKGGNQLLDVTINSMSIDIKSPQGDLSPDMSGVTGKAFAMTLTPLGEELDISGAEALKYSVGPGRKRDVKSDFETLFPDLAGTPLKVGGSWTTRDTLKVEEGSTNIQFEFKNDNTLAGYETVDGKECAKITTVVTGGLRGQGRQLDADLVIEGDIKGADTWYFAYKEGLLVKMVSGGTITGSITMSGVHSMVIPMTQTLKIETSLVRSTMKS